MSKTKARAAALADDFLARGYSEGRVIPTSVFRAMFGIKEPYKGMAPEEFESASLRFMSDMKLLQDELLDRGHDLQNKPRAGYYLVPFHDRPKAAATAGKRAINKAMNDEFKRHNSIKHPEQLTGEAKAIRDHRLMVIGYMRAFMRQSRRNAERDRSE